MKSELSFLVSLLLEHKLTVATKKAVQARIVEVEQAVQYQPGALTRVSQYETAKLVTASPPQQVANNQQAASTLALMAKHGMLHLEPQVTSAGPTTPPISYVSYSPTQESSSAGNSLPQPAEAPVVNPAAINQALAARQAMVEEALSDPEGKRSKRTSGLKVGMR